MIDASIDPDYFDVEFLSINFHRPKKESWMKFYCLVHFYEILVQILVL